MYKLYIPRSLLCVSSYAEEKVEFMSYYYIYTEFGVEFSIMRALHLKNAAPASTLACHCQTLLSVSGV